MMTRLLSALATWPNKKKPEETGPRYADIQARGIAAAIDLMLLFQLFHRLFDAIAAKLYVGIDQQLLAQSRATGDVRAIIELLIQSQLVGLWLLNALIQVVLIGVVYIGVQWRFGTTPGKWLIGLEVRRDDAISTPSKWQYFVRYLAYLPSGAALMLGFIWISFNKRRRGWHDMIAQTVVVHRFPRGWVWSQVKRGWRWMVTRLRRK